MIEDRSDRGGSSTSRPKPSPPSNRSATASSTSPSPGSSSRPSPSPRELLDAYGIEPSKALGQHFLVDPNLARAIAADAGVGSGRPGGRDRRGARGADDGARRARTPTACSRSSSTERSCRRLRSIASAHSVDRGARRRCHEDRLARDPRRRHRGSRAGTCRTTSARPIVLSLLERAPMVRRLVVMVQREVADRLVATPASRERYGPTSLRVAYHASAAIAAAPRPPSVFWPRPSVASASFGWSARDGPPSTSTPRPCGLSSTRPFGQRRKAMRGALRRLGAADPDAVLARAAVDPSARPEELDLAAFARVAEALPA